MTDQAIFRFDTHDLETIHLAVSLWCRANGVGLAHPSVARAARNAFSLYRRDMDEHDLAAAIAVPVDIAH